uniref:Putative secreted protein n=1 Tax=Anopheles darlingi TaxID=43151 RepID=A0A2M4DHX5_ANODA
MITLEAAVAMAEVAVVTTTAAIAIMITIALATTTAGATTRSRNPCLIWEEEAVVVAVREFPETVTICRTTISEVAIQIRAAIVSATTTVVAGAKAG